jgi:hypothetical protein
MSERRDPLDAALAGLQQNVQPTRDLWPEVRAAIAADAHAAAPRRDFRFGPVFDQWRQLAAGVVLAIAASATTYVVTRESMQGQLVQETPAPLLGAMPVSFGAEQLGADYFQAREALDAEFERRIAALPPATRAKLENDLADLRRAANEIAATLAQHPSDPLLQDLLLSTYRSELKLFADVNEMTTRTLRTDL